VAIRYVEYNAGARFGPGMQKGVQFAEFRDARHRTSKAIALSCEAITW
jgi:hypothetical protein